MLFLHQIFSSVWMIDSDYAANYIPLVASWIKGEQAPFSGSHPREVTEDNGVLFASIQSGAYHISDYGSWSRPENAPENSVAVINISGAITKYDQDCGPSGMATKAGLLERCYQNDNIKSVVLKVDSGGGEGLAMFLMNEAIAKKNKPVVGFVSDYACSAAYGLLTSCDMIVANSPIARIGSIGTYSTIVDYSKRFEMMGINLVEVYATQSTDKNKEFKEAIAGNLEPLRKMVDTFNQAFLSQVKTQRGEKLASEDKEWNTGKVFFAEQAKSLGLIDEIDTFDNVLNYFNT